MAERPLSRQRPYLLRAMHEWMTDNALTPHIVVDAGVARLDLPPEQVRDNRIVLNISYAATRGLVMGSEAVSFEAPLPEDFARLLDDLRALRDGKRIAGG